MGKDSLFNKMFGQSTTTNNTPSAEKDNSSKISKLDTPKLEKKHLRLVTDVQYLTNHIAELDAKRKELENTVKQKKAELGEVQQQVKIAVTKIREEDKRLQMRQTELKEAADNVLKHHEELTRRTLAVTAKDAELENKGRALSEEQIAWSDRMKALDKERVNVEREIIFLAKKRAGLEDDSNVASQNLREIRDELNTKKALISTVEKKDKELKIKADDLQNHTNLLCKGEEELQRLKKEFEKNAKDKAEQLRVWEKKSTEEDHLRRQSLETSFLNKDREIKIRETQLIKGEEKWNKMQTQLAGLQQLIEEKRVESKGFDKQIIDAKELGKKVETDRAVFLKECEKRELLLSQNETTMRDDEQAVRKEAQKILQQAQAKLQSLKAREKAIIDDEAEIGKQEKLNEEILHHIETSREDLSILKNGLAQEFELAKSSWQAARGEWDQKISLFTQNRLYAQKELQRISKVKLEATGMLEIKEQEIKDLIVQLEIDQKRLDSEEKGIINRIKKLELEEGKMVEQKNMLEETKVIAVNIHKTALKDAAIIKKEWEKVRTAKAKIARVKEIKVNLPSLEKRHADLSKAVQANEAKLIALTAEYHTKVDHHAIHKKVDLPNHKKERVQQKQEWIHEEPRHIAAKPKERYIPQEDDVYVLIAKANDALKTRNIDDAARYTAEAEVLADEIKGNKKMIYYDLQELKTNIKLAGLA